MTINASDGGYFSSNGVIRQDAFTASRRSSAAKTQDTADTPVAQKAASVTASAIADAAAVKIGSRMNVGATGFDSGVSAMVQQAISKGTAAKSVRSAGPESTDASAAKSTQDAPEETPAPKRVRGGTYQNELMQAEKDRQAKEAAAEQTKAAEDKAASVPQPASGEVDTVA